MFNTVYLYISVNLFVTSIHKSNGVGKVMANMSGNI